MQEHGVILVPPSEGPTGQGCAHPHQVPQLPGGPCARGTSLPFSAAATAPCVLSALVESGDSLLLHVTVWVGACAQGHPSHGATSEA